MECALKKCVNIKKGTNGVKNDKEIDIFLFIYLGITSKQYCEVLIARFTNIPSSYNIVHITIPICHSHHTRPHVSFIINLSYIVPSLLQNVPVSVVTVCLHFIRENHTNYNKNFDNTFHLKNYCRYLTFVGKN